MTRSGTALQAFIGPALLVAIAALLSSVPVRALETFEDALRSYHQRSFDVAYLSDYELKLD